MNRLALFKKNLLSHIVKFKSDTYKDYFERKINYNFESKKYDTFSDEKMQLEEEQILRIVTIQNMYFTKSSLFCEKKI